MNDQNPLATLSSPYAQGPGSLRQTQDQSTIFPVEGGPPPSMRSPAGVQSQPMPQPSTPPPAPQGLPPAQAPQEKTQEQQADDILAGLSPEDAKLVAEAAPPRVIEGKSFYGLKIKYDTATNTYESFNKEKGKYEPLSDEDKTKIRESYNSLSSLPATATSAIAALIPGEGPLAIGARMLGAGAGSGLSEQLASQPVADTVVKSLWGQDGLDITKSIAQPEKSPYWAAGLGALGQGLFEGIGAAQKYQVQKYTQQNAEAKMAELLKPYLKQSQLLENQASDAGVNLRTSQSMSDVPFLGKDLASQEGQLLKKGSPEWIAMVEAQDRENIQKLSEYASKIQSRFGNIGPEEELGINQVRREGGQRINFIDDLENKLKETINLQRNEVKLAIKESPDRVNALVDPQKLLSELSTVIGNVYGHVPQILEKDGSVNLESFLRYIRKSGNVDKTAVQLVGAINAVKSAAQEQKMALGSTLKNTVDRSEIIPTPESWRTQYDPKSILIDSPNVDNKAYSPLSFDTLTKLNDHIQDLVRVSQVKEGASYGALKQFSAYMKKIEDGTIADVYEQLGNQKRGLEIINNKNNFSNSIDDIRDFNTLVKSNTDSAAKFLYGLPKNSFNVLWNTMEDSSKKEIAVSLLRDAAYSSINPIEGTGVSRGFSANSFRQSLLGTPEAKAKAQIVFGDEALGDINKVINVGRALESNMGPRSAQAEDGLIRQVMSSLTHMTGKLGYAADKVWTYLRPQFVGNKNFTNIIDDRVSRYAIMMEQKIADGATSEEATQQAVKALQGLRGKKGAEQLGGLNFLSEMGLKTLNYGNDNGGNKK